MGVPSAPLPQADTAGNWLNFAQLQTGQLDRANARTSDSVHIVVQCEARDAATVKALTHRKFLGLF